MLGRSTVRTKTRPRIVVIGAGIGGLTTGALLARQGYSVLMLEQAAIPGGCASTFQRRGFVFDVGATQVAGLEPDGIHWRIFQALDLELPAATLCDPACAVFLPGETTPIQVWRDRAQWHQERQTQFPGSDRFWQFLDDLFAWGWAFQARDPVIPPRSVWDIVQTVKALRPQTFLTLPHVLSTVGDALKAHGLAENLRLRTFLDLQLKLYSQVDASETALLYAATALGVSHNPHGLFHLKGSMQTLSDRLVAAFRRDGGELRFRQQVQSIQVEGDRILGVTVCDLKTGTQVFEPADHVVANTTVQDLVQLLGDAAPSSYRQRVTTLPPGSGAFVIYLGVKAAAIPPDCAPHLQFLYDYEQPIGENNSLFVSVSQPGDGRAPQGYATIVASSFTDPQRWSETSAYDALKADYTQQTITRLGQYFDLSPSNIVHQEAATPRTFKRYTARTQGIVGGIGQRIATFGPFGVANRTPIPNLWLVGDSAHPGEGTAGVSYGAWTVSRQIAATDPPWGNDKLSR